MIEHRLGSHTADNDLAKPQSTQRETRGRWEKPSCLVKSRERRHDADCRYAGLRTPRSDWHVSVSGGHRNDRAREPACKPGSVGDNHSSGMRVAAHL